MNIIWAGFGVACALQASIADHLGFSVDWALVLTNAVLNVALACYYLGHLNAF